MLKSTYKPATPVSALPAGWTEHRAPSGHPYYYNATTQQSTYTKPTGFHEPLLQQGSNFTQSNSQSPFPAVANQNELHNRPFGTGPQDSYQPLQDRPIHGPTDFRGLHNHRQRLQPVDRPKAKHAIPGCPSWLLIETRLGRRFVYNSEKNESYWKFPPEVLKGVIEYDRLEREKREKPENGNSDDEKDASLMVEAKRLATPELPAPGASPPPASAVINRAAEEEDSDEYEEVEVTDDEDDPNPSKRQKTEDADNPDQPVEFNEDDMAYQLAAMGQDYGLDPGEYGGDGEELEEGAEGLELTEEDSSALFRDMLNDYNISPYTTWETIIEGGQIVEDDRYTVLPNMKSRKEVWGEWSRERIQQLKEQRETEEKKDPRIPYMAFLQKYATPKLYWPEFKRKYKKESEMRNTKISDKDREKWYRDYVTRLKLPESTLKSDLAALLKFLPLHVLHKSVTLDTLPPVILTDLRYISLKAAVRDPIIQSHIASLPPAPSDTDVSPEEVESLSKQRQERERRERALADRQTKVQDEKARQQGALRYSKGILREGELELERARKTGKEGLMGYMQEDAIPSLPSHD